MRALLAAVMLLAGCAKQLPPPRPQITSADVNRAVEQLRECHQRQIPGMDDPASDASTVGRAVAKACSADGEAWYYIQASAQPEARRRALRAQWPTFLADIATQSVLKYRAARK